MGDSERGGDRRAAEGDNAVLQCWSEVLGENMARGTYEAIVLARHGLLLAGVAGKGYNERQYDVSRGRNRSAAERTEDADGRAGDTDGDVEALEGDGDEVEEATRQIRVRRARLHETSVLRPSTDTIESTYRLNGVAALEGTRVGRRGGRGGRGNDSGGKGKDGEDASEHGVS